MAITNYETTYQKTSENSFPCGPAVLPPTFPNCFTEKIPSNLNQTFNREDPTQKKICGVASPWISRHITASPACRRNRPLFFGSGPQWGPIQSDPAPKCECSRQGLLILSMSVTFQNPWKNHIFIYLRGTSWLVGWDCIHIWIYMFICIYVI